MVSMQGLFTWCLVFLDFQMDVRDMSLFGDGTFDCVLDKGTLRILFTEAC